MTGTHPLNFWVSYLIVDVMYVSLVSALVVLVVWIAEESSLYTMHEGACKDFGTLLRILEAE